jgi:hypothetical protein
MEGTGDTEKNNWSDGMFSILVFFMSYLKKHQIKREVMVAKRKGDRKLWVVFRSNFNSAF